MPDLVLIKQALQKRKSELPAQATDLAGIWQTTLDGLGSDPSKEDVAALCRSTQLHIMRADVQTMLAKFFIALVSLRVFPYERAGRTDDDGQFTHGQAVLEEFARENGIPINALREGRTAAVKRFDCSLTEFAEWLTEPLRQADDLASARPRYWYELQKLIGHKTDPDTHPRAVRGRMLAAGVERNSEDLAQLNLLAETGDISHEEYDGVTLAMANQLNATLGSGSGDPAAPLPAIPGVSENGRVDRLELWALDLSAPENPSVVGVAVLERGSVTLDTGEQLEAGKYRLLRRVTVDGRAAYHPLDVRLGEAADDDTL